MWKTAVNLSACEKDIDQFAAVPLVRQAGFDGCFIDKTGSNIDVRALASLVRENGLFLQSVHAPFGRMNEMWEEGDGGEQALAELMACLEESADAGAPIVICHVYIGFGPQSPNALGTERYLRLLDRAHSLGLKIAFENTEGELYLERIHHDLRSHPAAGFCIDTGHEMCYNRGRDLISLFGDRLIATHLNDNMGVTGPEIFWHDDAHMLPFDGVANWENIAQRLRSVSYRGALTFELTTKNKPGRTTHDRYAPLDPAAFYALAHEKALRFASLMQ